MAHTYLHIDASARHQSSTTRALSRQALEHLGATQVIRRDLSQSLPLITENWVGANFTPADQRTGDQKQHLDLSDQLVDELARADTLVIGLPIYNFSVPASFKAWIDLVARAGVTFRYTENGPEGLLTGKRAIIAVASGGTPVGSPADFATGYVRFILGFLGITDVTIVTTDTISENLGAVLETA